jgi:hypothetical protein
MAGAMDDIDVFLYNLCPIESQAMPESKTPPLPISVTHRGNEPGKRNSCRAQFEHRSVTLRR